MQSWVVMTGAALKSTDSLVIILVVALVCSMSWVQTDDTVLPLLDNGCLATDSLLHVLGAVGQTVI